MKKEFSTNDHIHPDNGKNPHNQDSPQNGTWNDHQLEQLFGEALGRVYLNDAPVGKGRQIRIRCGLYNKASRLIPFMAPGMSVSVYVSNIVEEHLKRHGELLKNELECFLYKDSLWKS